MFRDVLSHFILSIISLDDEIIWVLYNWFPYVDTNDQKNHVIFNSHIFMKFFYVTLLKAIYPENLLSLSLLSQIFEVHKRTA